MRRIRSAPNSVQGLVKSEGLSRPVLLLLATLLACTATNTGNPGMGEPGDPRGPEGIALVKSSLARQEKPHLSRTQLEGFRENSRDFAFALYRQAAQREGNLFISPYSVRLALGMLYAGAEGQTKAEMGSALRFDLPEPELHVAFNATDLALSGRVDELAGSDAAPPSGPAPSSGDLALRVVNAAFGQKDMAFDSAFLDTLAMHYGTGVYAADFAKQAERERLAINRWVEGITNARIQELLPMSAVDAMTRLVLVNTLYFKGSWLDPFDPSDTREEVFHAPTKDVTVPMMNNFAENYAEGEGYQALELSYIAPALRMLFILPAEGRLSEIESDLTRDLVDEIHSQLVSSNVKLKVPKFSFTSSFELKPTMEALGILQLFDPAVADLSGITGRSGLHVSHILHKTFVALDEEGTEAAASTAVIGSSGTGRPPAEFFLNRPFLFIIHDEPTGQLLFIGRVLDPG